MGLPLRRECGQCATAAERNPHVVPVLSEGYKRRIQWPKKVNKNGRFSLVNAGIAQLVEQLICNQQVVGSNPTAGSSPESFRGCHAGVQRSRADQIALRLVRSKATAWQASEFARPHF